MHKQRKKSGNITTTETEIVSFLEVQNLTRELQKKVTLKNKAIMHIFRYVIKTTEPQVLTKIKMPEQEQKQFEK